MPLRVWNQVTFYQSDLNVEMSPFNVIRMLWEKVGIIKVVCLWGKNKVGNLRVTI